jgi:hypothetical protein
MGVATGSAMHAFSRQGPPFESTQDIVREEGEELDDFLGRFSGIGGQPFF